MHRSCASFRTTGNRASAALEIGRVCWQLLLRTAFAGFFLVRADAQLAEPQHLQALPSSQSDNAATQTRSRLRAPCPRCPLKQASQPAATVRRIETTVAVSQPPIHVYPSGLLDEDEPRVQHVALQQEFVAPQASDVRFFESQPPDMRMSPTLNGHAGITDDFLPQVESSAFPAPDSAFTGEQPSIVNEHPELCWWESDLPQSVLRERSPIAMSLHQLLGLALSEAPELQILHSDWYIQQTEVDRLDAAFDWTTFVDAVWNRDSVPVSSALDGATNRLRSRTLNATGGIRRLSMNGSEIELSQQAGLRNSNSQFINPNNQATTRLSLQYERPLLRGGGEEYNTSGQRLAIIEKDAAFDRFQAGVQDHLLQVATAYWTLVLRRGRFVQSVRSWNRATEIAEEMATRTEIDVTPSMLDRARSEVAGRLSIAIESEHDILRAQDALLRLVYGARFTDFAANEIVTTTLPMRQADPLSPEPQIERALQNRSEIHQAIRDIKGASIRYNVAANEVLPALNMVLTSYVAGLRGDNDVAGSFARQFYEGEPGVGIGFNFEVPYRNRAAQAFAEQAHIGMKRVQAQLQLTLGEVTQDVRDQVIQRNKFGSVLDQRWESLARTRRMLEYSETRREVLADGTDVADLYLENLLNMQSRLVSAEGLYLEAQVRYALADNGLLRAISELETIADSYQSQPNEACLSDAAETVDTPDSTDIVAVKTTSPATSGHSTSGSSVPPVTAPMDSEMRMNQALPSPSSPVSFGHTLSN